MVKHALSEYLKKLCKEWRYLVRLGLKWADWPKIKDLEEVFNLFQSKIKALFVINRPWGSGGGAQLVRCNV